MSICGDTSLITRQRIVHNRIHVEREEREAAVNMNGKVPAAPGDKSTGPSELAKEIEPASTKQPIKAVEGTEETTEVAPTENAVTTVDSIKEVVSAGSA
jgi:hypothetical protein